MKSNDRQEGATKVTEYFACRKWVGIVNYDFLLAVPCSQTSHVTFTRVSKIAKNNY